MEKTKKNNKGFSLVELIVVVLIMAIIAVSLAPQVMKWVDRSRQANDASNYDALYAAAQMAVIAKSFDGTITMSPSGTDSSETDGGVFEKAMDANLPGWKSIKITSKDNNGKTYIITIAGTKITKGAVNATSGNVILDADGNILNAPGEISAN